MYDYLKRPQTEIDKIVKEINNPFDHLFNDYFRLGYAQGLITVVKALKHCDKTLYENYIEGLMTNEDTDEYIKRLLNEMQSKRGDDIEV